MFSVLETQRHHELEEINIMVENPRLNPWPASGSQAVSESSLFAHCFPSLSLQQKVFTFPTFLRGRSSELGVCFLSFFTELKDDGMPTKC